MKKMPIDELWQYLPDWVNYICTRGVDDILLYEKEPWIVEGPFSFNWSRSRENKMEEYCFIPIQIDWQCEWQDSLRKRLDRTSPLSAQPLFYKDPLEGKIESLQKQIDDLTSMFKKEIFEIRTAINNIFQAMDRNFP